jgi:hypothetical protein
MVCLVGRRQRVFGELSRGGEEEGDDGERREKRSGAEILEIGI